MKKDKQNRSPLLPGKLSIPEEQHVATDPLADRTNPRLYLHAQQFALTILADPILKDLYTTISGNRCTAYSLALSEFLALREEGQWIF